MSLAPSLPFVQVDAFTTRPFGGNPAAVLVLDRPLDAHSMQLIAAEMNLSETAFTGLDADGQRWIRWFTPAVEVPLCGHATLATAHVLFGGGADAPVRFHSASGLLTVDREGDRLRMDFPADPPAETPAPQGLLAALGCPADAPAYRARNLWIVRLSSADRVRALTPDFGALARVEPGTGALGVAVTGPGTAEVDFVSRFFCPWVGIDEDPVTGVAHTALAPYWAAELGRTTLEARQVSRREGRLTVRVVEDRVHLIGSAVTVARGQIVAPDAS